MEKLKFLLTIDCVFNILTKGLLVTGNVAEGKISLGDELELRGDNGIIKVQCVGLEKYCKPITQAIQGEYIAVYLSGTSRENVTKGMRLVLKE